MQKKSDLFLPYTLKFETDFTWLIVNVNPLQMCEVWTFYAMRLGKSQFIVCYILFTSTLFLSHFQWWQHTNLMTIQLKCLREFISVCVCSSLLCKCNLTPHRSCKEWKKIKHEIGCGILFHIHDMWLRNKNIENKCSRSVSHKC